MFIFNETPRDEIRNKLLVKYKRNYGKFETEQKDTNWLAVYEQAYLSSISMYGERLEVFEFWAVTDSVTVGAVSDFQIFQRAVPRMTVGFSVYYEHFDLKVGDTFDITNPLYDGVRFFIETINRVSKSEFFITARSWTDVAGDYLVYYGGGDAIQFFGVPDVIVLI